MRNHNEIYYRPHKAFLAEQCPSSMLRNPNLIVKEVVGVPAHLGTACHQVFEHYIVPQMAIEEDDIVKIANEHNVEVEGYNGLKWRVRKLQTAYTKLLDQGFLKHPISEEKWEVSLKNGYQYTCYPDLYEIHGDWAVIFELKTGKVDNGWEYQARDYGLALRNKFQGMGIKKVFSIVFAPIIDYYNVQEFDMKELTRLEDKLVSSMGKVGEYYVVGDACTFCSNLLNCRAMKSRIDPLTRDILAAGKAQNITGADIRKWRGVIKGLKKIVDIYDSAEKLILKREGTIKLSDTTELYLREQYKKEVDAGKAIAVMVDQFGVDRDAFIERLDIKTSSVEALSDTTAPARGMASQRKKVWDAMEKSGAMKKVLQQVKATRPIKLKKESQIEQK